MHDNELYIIMPKTFLVFSAIYDKK